MGALTMFTGVFTGVFYTGNLSVQSGFSPLHIAAHYGNVGVARLLTQHGADVNRVSDKVSRPDGLLS